MTRLRDIRARLLPALALIGFGARLPALPAVPGNRHRGGGKTAKQFARWKSRNRMARASRRANRAG